MLYLRTYDGVSAPKTLVIGSKLTMDVYVNFKNKLDEVHTWPSPYLFKFVVPSTKKGELLSMIPSGLVQERSSSNEKYVSISLTAEMGNADEVVAVYKLVSQIEGIMTL